MTKPKTSKSRPRKARQTAGQAFRDAVLGLYVLDPSERTLLDRIAALLDIVTRLEERIAAEDVITKGSRGQDVASPLLTVHRPTPGSSPPCWTSWRSHVSNRSKGSRPPPDAHAGPRCRGGIGR